MRNKIIALLIALLGATAPGFAQDDISTSTGIIGNGRLLGAKTYDGQTTVGILGIDSNGNTIIKALSGSDVLLPGTLKLANNVYIQARNAAGSADIDVIKVDATDDVVINSDASDVVKVQIGGDAQRLFTFNASSDTDFTLTFGDGGTTAAQNLVVKPSNADGDDDAYTCLAGGSACSRAGGGYAIFNGNEVASVGGNVEIGTGAGAADTIDFAQGASGLITARIDGSGISLPISGDTLLLQEATAGDKCMGSLTLNGATPVVTSTTCAKTASRVFLTRTSIDADTTGDMAVTAISDGVSFSVTSEASDTATVNWLIINEAA